MLAVALALIAPVQLFVSPEGKDSWSGALQYPNEARTDGPKATIAGARDRLRKAPKDEPAMVLVLPGVYRITQPIVFGPQDSGSPNGRRSYIGPTTIDSEEEPAVVSGLREIKGWKQLENGWWRTTVERGWTFSQLFVNGERRYRPRFPKIGYYTIAEKVDPTEAAKGKGFDRFQFHTGAIKANWANRGDVEILNFHLWGMSRNRIKEVDEAQKVVTFKAPTGYDANWADLPKGNRYLLENVKEGLSEPGEWYLDRPTGELTYIPMKGEKPQDVEVEAPVARSLVEMRGAQYIQLTGLSFEGTNWNVAPNGRNFPQAEADLRGAINLRESRFCAISSCEIRQTGEYAIEVGAACKQIEISKNAMEDLGAGGIKVGEMAWQKEPELLTERVDVLANIIQGGGRLHPAAVGVWVGQNPYVHIGGNYIHDLYYTGISVGWSWGYQPNGAHHNTITMNRIGDLGQGVLSDMGGIYTLGPQEGTVISNNRIHDVRSFSYGGWGIYPDEGSTGISITRNCVYRTSSAGFHQHYGKENSVTNNVFAFGKEAQVMRTRAEDHLSLGFERNIVFYYDAPLLGGNWTGEKFSFDHNIYWRTDGKPVDFAGETLAQWQKRGQDKDSYIIDPLFKDSANADFSLLPQSPAFELGFTHFPALEPAFDSHRRRKLPPAFPIGSATR